MGLLRVLCLSAFAFLACDAVGIIGDVGFDATRRLLQFDNGSPDVAAGLVVSRHKQRNRAKVIEMQHRPLAPVSQLELFEERILARRAEKAARDLEDKRADIRRRLQAGAALEPGELKLDDSRGDFFVWA